MRCFFNLLKLDLAIHQLIFLMVNNNERRMIIMLRLTIFLLSLSLTQISEAQDIEIEKQLQILTMVTEVNKPQRLPFSVELTECYRERLGRIDEQFGDPENRKKNNLISLEEYSAWVQGLDLNDWRVPSPVTLRKCYTKLKSKPCRKNEGAVIALNTAVMKCNWSELQRKRIKKNK